MKVKLSIMCLALLSALATAAQTPEKDLKITVFGSSTVWGNGLLGERSMAGVIDNYLRNSLSSTVYPENMKFSSKPVIVNNRKFYRGNAAKISGTGSSVEFDITGRKLVIWQAISRTKDYGVMTVYADGREIGTFDNKNNSIGSGKRVFKGNGKQKMFPLGRPCTYKHEITVGGKPQKFKHYDQPYVKGKIESFFPGYDGVIVRAKPKDKVEHFLCFFKAPAEEVKVKFNYGDTIAYTGCTVGGIDNDENTLESTFGIGRIPYDLANPTQLSSGLDFRYSNLAASKVFEFDNSAKRHIRIVISGGENPYFMINFASNMRHEIMNAGIGGFTASYFLKHPNRLTVRDAMQQMVPDAAFIILGGNDDWAEKERLVERKITGLSAKEVETLHSMFYRTITPEKDGTYTAIRNAGIIDDITDISLTSKQLVGAKLVPGNYLRIGSYYGENRSTAVRRVKTFDSKKGIVTWEKPLDAENIIGIEKISDLKGAEFTARTLDFYKSNITKMIKVLRQANPEMKIVLLNTYTPNYFCREVWAYGEALEDVAKNHSGVVATDSSPNVFEWIEKTQFAETKRVCPITSTGAAMYDIPKVGHWQGFQVLVNGKDVYGKDCRVESGSFYAPVKNRDNTWKTGRTSKWVKQNLKLVFTKNIPPAGTKIIVKLAHDTWSNDYAHPTPAGCVIIGETAYKALCEVMKIQK